MPVPLSANHKVMVADENGNSYGTDLPSLTEFAGKCAEINPASSADWSTITNKPATFTPSAHSHAPSEVTGTAVVDADARLTNDRKPSFVTGDGGTATQAGNKSNSVTINKRCGQITMNGAALAAGAEVTFTVTNSTVAATDVPVVCVQSVGTAGSYLVSVGAVANGSFAITVSNASAGSLSQALVLNFVVIKAVNS